MTAPETPRHENVRGLVVPIAWSPMGEPLRVAILTPDEGEYQVDPCGAGSRLFDVLREEVEARVVVHQDRKGTRIATVVSFAVVDGLPHEPPVDDEGPARGTSGSSAGR